MAYLWHNLNDDKWSPNELHRVVALGHGSVDLNWNKDVAKRSGDVLLYPHSANTRAATWMLLAPADSQLLINDAPLESGIRIVADRDAIRVADMPTMYFSTERLARIEKFPDAESVFCPRCKMTISEGDSAVCCPTCKTWLHEQGPEGKDCWSYAATCSLCDQSTDLESAGFRWTPEFLWS